MEGEEPLIGLKLGKRTYFKFHMTANPKQHPRCIVQGCDADLSAAKPYHRKHKVCDPHSKCSKVLVDGLDRRFCQQCTRFHALSEFDDNKRSCRSKLMNHNARRRKRQPSSSSAASPSFLDWNNPMFTVRDTRAVSLLSPNTEASSSSAPHEGFFCFATQQQQQQQPWPWLWRS